MIYDKKSGREGIVTMIIVHHLPAKLNQNCSFSCSNFIQILQSTGEYGKMTPKNRDCKEADP